MAAVKGTNVTGLDAMPRVMPDADQWHGRIRVQRDTYEASALAIGSTIDVAVIQPNSRIHNVLVKHDALGASSTLAVGDAEDDDRFVTARATASAGAFNLWDDGVIDNIGHRYDVETRIKLKTAGAAITGTIVTEVWYAND